MDENQNNNIHNKNAFNHKKSEELYYSGIEQNVDKLINEDRKGKYYSSRNARPTSDITEDSGAATRIDGEVVVYEKIKENYISVGSIIVKGKKFSIWASPDDSKYSFISIDGVIVCESEKLPFNYNNKLQIDKNENCIGGEVYITDGVNTPFLFSIKDLEDNLSTEKYFSNFNPVNHQTKIDLNIETVVLEGVIETGGGSGLPVGQYAYSLIFGFEDGTKTSPTPRSPLIPITQTYSKYGEDSPFAYRKTIGSDPDPNTPTSYSVKTKFRIDNKFGFDFVQVIRLSYNKGEALGFVPNSEIVKTFNLEKEQFSVIEYVDGFSTQDTPITLDDKVFGNELSAIKSAKTLRYFEKKLFLMNVEFESRDISDIEFDTEDGKIAFYPITENIGIAGYNEPMACAYRRSLMNGEKYGWGIECFDSGFKKSFVLPIKGFESFKMPERRDKMSAKSIEHSEKPLYLLDTVTGTSQPVFAKDLTNTIEKTFEVVDYEPCRVRTTQKDFAEKILPNFFKNIKNILRTSHTNNYNSTPAEDIGFNPLLPTRINDNQEHWFRPQDKVEDDGSSKEENFNPKVFNPAYSALGMSLKGVSKFPEWVTSFRIVRTKKAGVVKAQGLSFYLLSRVPIESSNFPNNAPINYKKKLIFKSPDIQSGIASSSIIDDLKNNSQNYKLQFISPLGVSNEVFNANQTAAGSVGGSFIDMLTIARLHRENPSQRTNPIEPISKVGDGNGWIEFGKWLNSSVVNFFQNNTNGYKTNIVGIEEQFEEGNVVNYIIEVEDEIDNYYIEDELLKKTPVYIANIIQEDVEVQDSDFTEYYPTEAFIKLKSTIGYGSDGFLQTQIISGERPEDFHCFPTEASIHKYIYIDINNNGEYQKLININEKTVQEKNDILSDVLNETNNYNGEYLYGVYISTPKSITVNYVKGDGTIKPLDNGAKIEVRYDKRFPIKVFGGDTFTSPFTEVLTHRKGKQDGATTYGNGIGDGMRSYGRGFPYHRGRINTQIYIPRKSDGGTNKVQDKNEFEINDVRQHIVIFDCQSIINNCFNYEEIYPNINYILRPGKYKDGIEPQGVSNGNDNDNRVYRQYNEVYTDEYKDWRFGGFKITDHLYNLDYSKTNNVDVNFRKPETAFKEETKFCTRIIASAIRQINDSNMSSLKFFSELNYYDLTDRNGAIMRAFSTRTATQSQTYGDNLYAVCENDLAMLMVDKRMLSQISGEELSSIGSTGLQAVQQHIWLNQNKEKAIQKFCEFSFSENGDNFFFINKNTVLKFVQNQLIDIGALGFKKTVNDLTSLNFSNFNIVSVFETLHKEYWLMFSRKENKYIAEETESLDNINLTFYIEEDNPYVYLDLTEIPETVNVNINLVTKNVLQKYVKIKYIGTNLNLNFGLNGDFYQLLNSQNSLEFAFNIENGVISYDGYSGYDLERYSKLVVWSEKVEAWIDSFDYRFDNFYSDDNKTYGFKDTEVYELGKGNLINNSNIIFELGNIISKESDLKKEFKKFRVHSIPNKPTSIVFGTDNTQIRSVLQGIKLKDYGGYEYFIPVDSFNNKRLQGMFLYFKIINNNQNKIVVRKTTVQYKNLN